MCADWRSYDRKHGRRATALQRGDDASAHAIERTDPPRRILDDLGAIERGTQHGSVSDLTAQAAADAIVVHMCDGIRPQRIWIGCDRERGAAGQSDAGMVAGADVGIDAEARADDALAFAQILGDLRSNTALKRELAFAVGDDHLQPTL